MDSNLSKTVFTVSVELLLPFLLLKHMHYKITYFVKFQNKWFCEGYVSSLKNISKGLSDTVDTVLESSGSILDDSDIT